MRISRSAVLGVTVWLAIVAIGSTMVWSVISRVGDGVVSSGGQVAAEASDNATGSPAQPSDPASPDASPRAGATNGAVERHTWHGQAGEVVAECDRAAVTLVAAQPAPGFAVELKDDGPDRLEVEFEGREGEEGREAKVDAVCVDGVPRFTEDVESD